MAIDCTSDPEVVEESNGKPEYGGGNGGGGIIDAKERHKLLERERRKSMTQLFSSLHSLLPNSRTIRNEQSAILDALIEYIPKAADRLRSLQTSIDDASSSTTSSVLSNSKFSSLPAFQGSSDNKKNKATSAASTISDCDIRIAPKPSSSVALRVRGDRVNVTLVTKSTTPQNVLIPADVLDELENHQLELVRSTHCRDATKVLHHFEAKICDELEKSPAELQARLQELAKKLQKPRKSTLLKRTFDQTE
ncbi:hypothetical protein C5167_033970 [Papaver somniferum]|uniref:BHLH domain-containing protein n=1 Tax=Papaver somniferum TaxID=3469 RepID=A0A4Y7KBT4_PAPSO|nr:transcription factor bHLH99-like [Papaver somniferum]RZC70833.1 hypothetical protein C5167_033970 [Papaver somniferum]